MQAYIILGILLGLPLFLGLLFRVSASNMFLSVLAGDILQRYFTDDAIKFLKPIVHNQAILDYVGLAILVLPLLLTAVFMHGSLSRSKTILHIIPLIITGVIFAAFAVHLLPSNLLSQLTATNAGQMLSKSTGAVIGAMVGLQLVTMWLFGREKDSKKKK